MLKSMRQDDGAGMNETKVIQLHGICRRNHTPPQPYTKNVRRRPKMTSVEYNWSRTVSCTIGMKTEQKRTKLTGATFVFIFFYESENEYRNLKNKYETTYYQKQIQTEYSTDTDEKRMITKNKRLLESCRKLMKFQVNMTNQPYHNF
jgi:hypothetical protein